MPTYISLLRGINVSGHNLIKMEALKSSYASLGFKEIVSYIQSGNLIFTFKNTPLKKLESVLSRKIKQDFGMIVPVLVLEKGALKKTIQNNPFLMQTKMDPAFFHISFLSEMPDPEKISALEKNDFTPDKFIYKDKAIYLYCPNGYGQTKLTSTFLEKKLEIQATTRNWKTVQTLLDLAEKK